MKQLLLTTLMSLLAVAGLAQDSVTVTINLSMSVTPVDPGGVYIAGGSAFGVPGSSPAFELTDPDGDSVYTVTFTIATDSAPGYYTFANGACADYSCKENIAGQPCADPANFNDRFLPSVTQDTVINTCFGECTDDLVCSPPGQAVNVTFTVDMNEADSISANGVVLGGQVEDPDWQFVTTMADPQGDGIYTVTMSVIPGQYEYKFANGGGDNQESFPPDSLDCTLTTGTFTNRLVMVPDSDIVVGPFVYNSCEILRDTSGNLLSTHILTPTQAPLFEVAPTVIGQAGATLTFAAGLHSAKTVTVLNLNGQVMSRTEVPAQEMTRTLPLSGLANGLYFIRVQADEQVATRKVVIRR